MLYQYACQPIVAKLKYDSCVLTDYKSSLSIVLVDRNAVLPFVKPTEAMAFSFGNIMTAVRLSNF